MAPEFFFGGGAQVKKSDFLYIFGFWPKIYISLLIFYLEGSIFYINYWQAPSPMPLAAGAMPVLIEN